MRAVRTESQPKPPPSSSLCCLPPAAGSGAAVSPQHGSLPALLHVGSLPKPLLCGLPTARSSSSTAPCGPALQGLSVRSQWPQHRSPRASCSCVGSSTGCSVGICSMWCPGAAGLSLLHHGPAAPMPRAPPARLPYGHWGGVNL